MTDRRQRQKEMRAARAEEARRLASRKEMRRRIGIALGIGLSLAAGFLIVGSLANRQPTLPAAYLAFRDLPTACEAQPPPLPEPVAPYESPADQQVDPAVPVTARLLTSCGEVEITLEPAGHPATVNSFVFLARENFYDGQVFHRIFPGFVIQGGDPRADGSGGPGYLLPDEFPPTEFVFEPGVVAMANRGSGSTGSQFFIVIGEDAAVLQNTFNVLGRVTGGEETLERIAAVPTAVQPGSAERSRPLEAVYIEDVVIEVGS